MELVVRMNKDRIKSQPSDELEPWGDKKKGKTTEYLAGDQQARLEGLEMMSWDEAEWLIMGNDDSHEWRSPLPDVQHWMGIK